MRVIVAMSGGVDSSVAAARLLDAGHEVIGVTLHLWDYPEAEGPGSHGRCCAPEDQYDARRVADALGFPHFSFDRRELFAREVVAPFVEAYVAGETPSPCTACNRGVKLAELFAIADRLGAPFVATGHYARVVRVAAEPGDARGPIPRLAMGTDRSKDQSYFLYASPREWLDRLVLPLGEATKAEVRAEAVARQLPGATKGESQELCFVGSGAHAYARFVEERAPGRIRPGLVVDEEGRPVGAHAGVHAFTVGQRRGLGVALGRPAFVTRIDPDTATVHVGGGEHLMAGEAGLSDVVLAEGVSLPRRARVRVRYRHEGDDALVTATARPGAEGADGTEASVRFDRPVRAVTRGQIAVFYDGDRVLGGGRIRNVTRASPERTEPRGVASPSGGVSSTT
jgi:tRNA-specific 2-thiouridylase